MKASIHLFYGIIILALAVAPSIGWAKTVSFEIVDIETKKEGKTTRQMQLTIISDDGIFHFYGDYDLKPLEAVETGVLEHYKTFGKYKSKEEADKAFQKFLVEKLGVLFNFPALKYKTRAKWGFRPFKSQDEASFVKIWQGQPLTIRTNPGIVESFVVSGYVLTFKESQKLPEKLGSKLHVKRWYFHK